MESLKDWQVSIPYSSLMTKPKEALWDSNFLLEKWSTALLHSPDIGMGGFQVNFTSFKCEAQTSLP